MSVIGGVWGRLHVDANVRMQRLEMFELSPDRLALFAQGATSEGQHVRIGSSATDTDEDAGPQQRCNRASEPASHAHEWCPDRAHSSRSTFALRATVDRDDSSRLRSPDGSHLPALSSSTEEPIAAVGFEPGYFDSRRHLDPLQDLSCSRIDSSQLALVTLPCGVPQLSVDPRDSGDEAVGLDRAENGSCVGIDLIDLPFSIVPDPERAFCPREPRVTAAAGRWDRREDAAGLRIDLLDAIFGELIEVGAVPRRACMRGDIDGAHRPPARRVQCIQRVTGSEPHVLTVKGDAMYLVNTWKGAVLTDDIGSRSRHALSLVTWQGGRK